ncbi:hypothetical protein Cgig2_016555 [Carnegiea gigantea]|uniref:Uncharacterized protein n=1 Tax=Carnegiea gigantea TaxID=171969 RepID=A0A9Q1KZX7_9CARY|nr:hypothetical protein Cgig2_016555 [Carnegiea gigantea]
MAHLRPEGKPIELSTGNDHELFFKALDESGNDRNHGRDYFEIDLAGEWWRSRPLTRDFGNGTYSFILQDGHWNISQGHLGLKTLTLKEHRDSLESFFDGYVVPDTVLFNSGLHDGRYSRRLDQYVVGADHAISIWREMIEGSTVATLSFMRYMGINPSNMEAFNGILAEKLKAARLITGIIDYFDMTWAWHFDRTSNDGMHYGRFPSKSKWKDGQIEHQYFVDLMLGHVILNNICPM